MAIIQPGYAINHDLDGESRAALVITLSIFFGALSTFFVILRIYTRANILKIIDPDDILIIIAQIFTIGLVIVTVFSVKYGVGSHIWTLSPDSIVSLLKSYFSTTFIYLMAINTVKLSILFQIRRIFIGKIIQIVTLITIIFIILWTITGILLQALVCIPASSAWDPTVKGKCLNFHTVYLTMSVVNMIVDFTIFTIPLTVINKLNLSKRQKVIMFFIFGLGFFTCCVSIVRVRIVNKRSVTTPDVSWDTVELAHWTFLEVAVAIITACLPTLRPLVFKFMPSLFGTSASKKKDSSNGNQETEQSQNKVEKHSEIFVENMYNTERISDGIIMETEKKIQISDV